MIFSATSWWEARNGLLKQLVLIVAIALSIALGLDALDRVADRAEANLKEEASARYIVNLAGEAFAVDQVVEQTECLDARRVDLDIHFRWCGDYMIILEDELKP